MPGFELDAEGGGLSPGKIPQGDRHGVSRRLITAGLLGLAASPAIAQSGGGRLVSVTEKVMVPMRDGVRIAIDLYAPAGPDGAPAAGRFPVILQRWSYGRKANGTEAAARFFASRGYVFASSDMRGVHDSEGEFYMHDPLNDPRDGHDLVEWLAAQRWSSGAVGTFGRSYGGHTQYNTAFGKPPHLKAQFIEEAVTNYHDGGGAWSQGAWLGDHNLSHTLRGILYMRSTRDNPQLKKDVEAALAHYDEMLARPAAEHVEWLARSPAAQKWYRDWLTHPSFDGYWKQFGINPTRYGDYPAVPILFWGGWYDHMTRPFLGAYEGLKRANAAPKELVVGPWNHGGSQRGHADADFGAEAAPSTWEAADAWFSRWLKGQDGGAVRPVRIFVMGSGDGHRTPEGKLFHGGYWRDESAYPLARAKPTVLHLQSGGRLAAAAPARSAPSRLVADPANPIPTILGRIGGAYDQRCKPSYEGCKDDKPLDRREGVLVFRTDPLAAATEVTGPISVTLHFRTDVRDTDLAVKLIDEYPPSKDFPDGFALILVDALRRARYRETLESESLLKPGKRYEMTIELPPTSNLFKAGHRIRLDISGSNYPKFDVNPNTGEPIQFHTHQKVAHTDIFHDRGAPSSVTLPIVPLSKSAT